MEMRKNTLLGKLALLLFVLLIALSAQSFCADDVQAQPARGGTLRIGVQADAVILGYPPTIRRVNSMRAAYTCLETLTRHDDTGKPVAWLASGWKIGDDLKSITLTLRKGVKFHDGSDFNAEAVKWNLDKYRETKRTALQAVSSVDVVDSHTVRLNLSKFDNTIIGNLAMTAGTIISPTAFKKHDQKWCEKNPVGTGPFKFVSWERDVRQVYERFDGYWQKDKPYLDRIEWIPIADPMTLLASLKSGEIDVLVEITPKDAKDLMESKNYNVTSAKIGVGGFGILFDSANSDSPFADVRVRQAATHAIDLKTIVAKIIYNFFEHTNQLVSPGHWAYNDSVKGNPYDTATAKKLLADAGYPNGFKTKLTSWNQPAYTVEAFTAVQGYLKEVGIDAELELVDTGRLHKIVVGGSWEGMMWAAPGSPNPDATWAFLADLSARSPLWKLMLHPDEYEKTLTQGLEAPKFEDKQKLTRELQRLVFDQYALMIPLWSRADLAGKHQKVHDDGLYTVNRTQWTPYNAWVAK